MPAKMDSQAPQTSPKPLPTPSQVDHVFPLIQKFNALTKDLPATSFDITNPSNAASLSSLALLASRIQTSLQPPAEVAVTQAFGINLHIAVRACVDLDIFTHLTTHPPSTARYWTTSHLAAVTGAQPQLLQRLLQAVVAMTLVDAGPTADTYVANPVTFALAVPSMAAGIALCYDNAARPQSNFSAFLEWWKERGWVCADDARDGPWQRANGYVDGKLRGTTTTWEAWSSDCDGRYPGELARFQLFMQGSRRGLHPWFKWWDVQNRLIKGFSPPSPSSTANGNTSTTAQDDDGDEVLPSDILVVDLGAGQGQDLLSFTAAFPPSSLPPATRLILTDLPEVINQIPSTSLPSSITALPYNLFQPLPPSLRGARCYFMHWILHDFPDSLCITILEHLRDGMVEGGYSKILINDAVLPDRGAGLRAVAQDWTMMAHHGACERSEGMWIDLVGRVKGLRVSGIWEDGSGGEGLVEVERVA